MEPNQNPNPQDQAPGDDPNPQNQVPAEQEEEKKQEEVEPKSLYFPVKVRTSEEKAAILTKMFKIARENEKKKK